MLSFNHCLRKLKTSVLYILPHKSSLLTPNYSHYYSLNYFKSQRNEVFQTESSIPGVVFTRIQEKESIILSAPILSICHPKILCFAAKPYFKQIPNLLSTRTPKHLQGFKVFRIFFLYIKKRVEFYTFFLP